MTLALFLMFDKWEEIGSDIKTEGYQCVRDYKVRKWTQRDPNWAIKWELLSFRQATWSDFSSSGPLSISEKKKTKKVLQPVTCNEDVCTLYTLQIIQTAAKVTKMPWYMMYIGELHFTDWAWQISDTSSTNLASGGPNVQHYISLQSKDVVIAVLMHHPPASHHGHVIRQTHIVITQNASPGHTSLRPSPHTTTRVNCIQQS